MAWYRLKNAKGEIRYAAGLGGEDLTIWAALEIARCPEPWETVADDGTIIADLGVKAQQDSEAALNRMTAPDRFDLAVATAKQQVIDDMIAAGVISATAATAMKSAPSL
jgi:hypothetical protein